MTGRIVLLILPAVLAALCFLPLRLLAEYDHSGGRVTVRLGPVSLRLFPRPPKKEKRKGRKKSGKKEEKTSKTEDAGAEKGGKAELLRELISLGLAALGALRRRLRLEDMTLVLTLGGKDRDAASWALLYGRAWAAIGALIPLLERALVIESRDVRVGLDPLSGENLVTARGVIRIRLGQLLCLALRYGLRALKIFLSHKASKTDGGGAPLPTNDERR